MNRTLPNLRPAVPLYAIAFPLSACDACLPTSQPPHCLCAHQRYTNIFEIDSDSLIACCESEQSLILSGILVRSEPDPIPIVVLEWERGAIGKKQKSCWVSFPRLSEILIITLESYKISTNLCEQNKGKNCQEQPKSKRKRFPV